MRITKISRRVLAALTALVCLAAPWRAMAMVIALPVNTERIEDQQFRGSDELDEVWLPEGLKAIGALAFADSSLKAVNLPASLEDIAADAFAGTTLEKVTLEAETYAYDWFLANGSAALTVVRTCDWHGYAVASGDLIRAWDGNVPLAPGCEAFASARLTVRVAQALPDIAAYAPVCIVMDGETHFLIQFADPESARDCADFLAREPGVLYAEPDGVMQGE